LEKGKWRWRCCHCLVKHLAPTFSDTSTRNALDHLLKAYSITKENPLGGPPQEESRIHLAFQNTIPKINFNEDIFQSFLL